MKRLIDLIVYILNNYPTIEELSKPRLVKLIYLIDWKYTIDFGEQYTNIKWFYNHYGPYVDEVIDTMKQNNDIFEVESYINFYGSESNKFRVIDNNYEISLNDNIKKIADLLIDYTYKLKWNEFIGLVYSTYPIKVNSKYSYLDLKELASEFRKLKGIKATNKGYT